MKRLGIVFVAVVSAMVVGCAQETTDENIGVTQQELSAPKRKVQLDAPSLTVLSSEYGVANVRVCAGPSGAPSGFVLQWHLKGGDWPADTCGSGALGFNGQSKRGGALAPGACMDVSILHKDATECSAPPLCGGDYSFRAFAQADSDSFRSPFGGEVSYDCSVAPPVDCDVNQWECYCLVYPNVDACISPP